MNRQKKMSRRTKPSFVGPAKEHLFQDPKRVSRCQQFAGLGLGKFDSGQPLFVFGQPIGVIFKNPNKKGP